MRGLIRTLGTRHEALSVCLDSAQVLPKPTVKLRNTAGAADGSKLTVMLTDKNEQL
jgi:hypothetical protein